MIADRQRYGAGRSVRETKYLLVGGGLASIRAAQQIRRADAKGPIQIVSEEDFLPYDRPPLSKAFLQGAIGREQLLLDTPANLTAQRIGCILGSAVAELSLDQGVARLRNGDDIAFQQALIATGARPRRLDVPGAELAGVHYLRTAQDAENIRADALSGGRAVIIGGGFIGLEAAATLRVLGLDVTIVEALPQIWSRLCNPELSDYVSSYCEARGVRVLTGARVIAIEGERRVACVVLDTGEALPCDLVCVGVGVQPNVEVAATAGLEIDNGIVVDGAMRTSHPNVFAAGDVISYPDPRLGRRRRAEHWGHAEHSGQVAGSNMAGGSERYDLVPYVWSDVFDLHLEFAGDETAHDDQLRRGDPADGSFAILYLKEGRVTAFFAVNVPAREHGAMRRLVQTQREVSGREAVLRDATISLRTLL